MLPVIVLMVGASCLAAKLPSNERVTFVGSPRNDFIPITMSSLHDLDGDSKRLSRKHIPSQQESSKTSNRYIPSSDNQFSLDLYDPPSNYRRRYRNHHSGKQDKQKAKRYITSDEIRPKRNQQLSVSKDISNEFVPSPVDTQISQEYTPPASKHNTNQYASDKSIHISNQEKLKYDRMSTDFSHPEIDQYLPSTFLQQASQHDQSFNSNSNPTTEMSFSQNMYLPLTEVKHASLEYVPPVEANEYFFPINRIEADSNQYLHNSPQSNEKDYSNNKQINAIAATPSIQIADPNMKEVLNNNMAAERLNQFPLLPPSETQHVSKDFLPSSYKYEDKSSMKNFVQEITENFNQYQNSAPSPIPFSSQTEMETAQMQKYSPQKNQPNYFSSQPIFQEYLPLQDFNDQSVPELNENSKADRRNDFSYGQKSPAVQISTPVTHPHIFTHSQKLSNFTTLRPIKQFNDNSQFSQTSYQDNPSNQIERSSQDNSLKTEVIMTNFPNQGQGFDPAKYAANQYAQPAQSMPYGAKLPQQNSFYASPRSSNLPMSGLQTNSDKQYETTTINLNNKYDLANSMNNLRQPVDLIIPNPYEPYQQQHQHSYAKSYAHQSYPAESTTEAVPILKQTNEIAYDGSFHYETLTGDQTHVVQEGHIENPGTDDEEQVIHGSYSFVGGDGITYTVNYVADSNGFRAAGDHLPTPPPVPDVIQRSIEVNLAAEANKAAQEYQSQSQSQSGKKVADQLKGSHGYLNDQTSRNFDLETKRPIQNFRNPFSENFNNYRSYENPSSVNRNQYQNHLGNNNSQNKGYQNPQIDKIINNPDYQISQNDKKTYIQSVNQQSSYNSNAQGYSSIQTNTNNIAQGYPNAQTSNNNNINGYKNPQTTFNLNPQEYQNGQTSNMNTNQDYKNPEFGYINDNQSFQNYQTGSDNNMQNYKNPRIDDNDSSLGYQNSQIEKNNNQGYQNPQTNYNNNIQGYQTQQNGYNNMQGYLGSQTVTDKNDLGYSNPQVVDNNQYQSFPTNTQPAEIIQNYQSSETVTESSILPKETGYL